MKRREFMRCMSLGGGAGLAVAGCRDLRESRDSPAIDPAVRAEPISGPYGSLDPRIEVDLENIGWNLERIRELAKVPVLAVVKANAYGHGLVDVGKFLEGRGVSGLMVGKLSEAHELRSAGVRCPVFNFGPFARTDAEAVVAGKIVQSVFTEDARAIHEAGLKSGQRASINVHVDTGMNRAGVPVGKALGYLEMLAGLGGLRIRGISTTFTEDPEFDKRQLRIFLDICSKARDKRIDFGTRHAASSAGIFSGPEFHLDMVRPGISLYGYYPNAATRKENALGLKPALRLSGRITSVREVRAGESLSYLRAVRAERSMRVATVGIGYSDGYPPALGGKGFVLVNGRKRPVFPAVTSNHIMIDLQGDSSVKVGDDVILVDGKRDSVVAADVLAELAGISDYKVLIGLNPLLQRWHAG